MFFAVVQASDDVEAFTKAPLIIIFNQSPCKPTNQRKSTINDLPTYLTMTASEAILMEGLASRKNRALLDGFVASRAFAFSTFCCDTILPDKIQHETVNKLLTYHTPRSLFSSSGSWPPVLREPRSLSVRLSSFLSKSSSFLFSTWI